MPEEVANQIAAGEVIERPASVVKELVENALDAGARRIEVEIREGGKEYIRVTDDGCGIPGQEMELAFQRHATSKIRSVQDLSQVRTLGFRGEALPSIASVSELEMRSRPRGQEEGTLLHLEGGRVVGRSTVGCPVGTTVIVRRLFYNTPARYKFLKAHIVERRHVLDWMMRISLAQPACRFSVTADGREILKTPGDGDLLEAVAAVYGRHLAQSMLPVEAQWTGGRLHGWAARPDVHRGNRDQEVVIVNGRPIHSPMIARAIEKGFETLLPSRRFPVAVVHLEMDPAEIDVNVHPTKLEIKFADEQRVFREVMLAVRSALSGANLYVVSPRAMGGWPGTPPGHDARQASERESLPPSAERATGRDPETPEESIPAREDRPRDALTRRWQTSLFSASDGATGTLRSASLAREAEPPWPSRGWTSRGEAAAAALQRPAQQGSGLPERGEPPGMAESSGAAEARRRLRELRLLGYLDDVFLIGVSEGQLWVIDQHIVHERILYERFLRAARSSTPPPRQRLLHPVIFQLSPSDAALMEDRLEFLERSGFTIEAFGPRSFRILAVPAELASFSAEALSEAIIATLGDVSDKPGDERRDHHWAATLACRLAVKAGEILPLETARYLLQQLAEAENPFTCPHGRPIVVIFPRHDLERRFGRH